MIKKLAVLLVMVTLGVLLLPLVQAVAFGASPATLSFDIGKGDSSEEIVSVSTNSPTYLGVTYSVSDEISKYITISPTSGLKTKLNEPLEITVKAKSSLFEELGSHTGTITLTTAPIGNSEGGTGSTVATGVAVKVTVNIGTVKAEKPAGTKTISSSLILVLATIVLLVLAAVLFIVKPKHKAKK